MEYGDGGEPIQPSEDGHGQVHYIQQAVSSPSPSGELVAASPSLFLVLPFFLVIQVILSPTESNLAFHNYMYLTCSTKSSQVVDPGLSGLLSTLGREGRKF